MLYLNITLYLVMTLYVSTGDNYTDPGLTLDRNEEQNVSMCK